MKVWAGALVSLSLCLAVAAGARNVEMKLAWKRPLAAAAILAVHEKTLFAGAAQLNPRTGKPVKTFKLAGRGNEIKAIRFSNQTVIFQSDSSAHAAEHNDSYEYFWTAFDLKTGKELWSASQNCPRPAKALLAVCKDLAVLVKGERHEEVTALDARGGQMVWMQKQPRVIDLAVQGERIFIQTVENLKALSAEDGRVLWEVPLLGEVREAMTVGEGQVLVPRKLNESADSTLWALDQKSGETLWKKDFLSTDLFAAARRGNRIYLLAQPAELYTAPSRIMALNAADGKGVWSQETVTDFSGHDFQPVICDQQLLFWSAEPQYMKENHVSGVFRLCGVNLSDGQTELVFLPPEKEKPVYSRPVVCGDTCVYQDGEDVVGLKIISR